MFKCVENIMYDKKNRFVSYSKKQASILVSEYQLIIQFILKFTHSSKTKSTEPNIK